MSDTYKETKTFYFDNAVARVYFPELTAEERERRIQGIYKAAERLLERKTTWTFTGQEH